MEQTVLLQMKDITKNFPGVRALDKDVYKRQS